MTYQEGKTRKVLKLGVVLDELDAFVRAHHELGTPTLSATLGELCRFYEAHKEVKRD